MQRAASSWVLGSQLLPIQRYWSFVQPVRSTTASELLPWELDCWLCSGVMPLGSRFCVTLAAWHILLDPSRATLLHPPLFDGEHVGAFVTLWSDLPPGI